MRGPRVARTSVALMFLLLGGAAADELPVVGFKAGKGKLLVTIGGKPVATYVYADRRIPRPYFTHVRAPGGIQVTRNHPPVKGKDPTDHAAYHPGIWMAFGDINGSDYWRNKARVRHKAFLEKPRGGPGQGSFVVRNDFLASRYGKRLHGYEVCRYTFLVRPAGYLIVWDSTFTAARRELAFGDQEEMGLGVRVATPITEKKGGVILDAQGRKTAREVWGNAADWCDYSGTIGDEHVGLTLMSDPKNFRPSWWHARDYGLLVANPFGRRAFRKGAPSKVVVKPGETFRLRYGVLLHASRQPPVLAEAYQDFLRQIRN